MNNNPAISLPSPTSSTLRYYGVTQPTGAFWLAVLIAIGLHASLFLLLNGRPFKIEVVLPKPPVITWDPLPPALDDPPEAKPKELSNEAPSVQVPSLLDLPRLVTVETAFTQLIDPIAPVKIDGKEGIGTIPVSYHRGTEEGGDIPHIFRPSELDRAPEPITQVSPDYPFELKREGLAGNVRIGFIVDSHGNVVSPYVISSTNRGFERAAVDALTKWKFRPGMKYGRKVNTRMEQPIEFNMQP